LDKKRKQGGRPKKEWVQAEKVDPKKPQEAARGRLERQSKIVN